MALAPEKIFTYLVASLPPAAPASDPFFVLGNQFLVQKFAGGLSVTLAYDSEEPLLLLRRRDLAGLPLTAPQLFALGLRNLERLANSGQVKLHSERSIFSIQGAGKFSASLLLLPRVWERVRQKLGTPQLLAIAPTRDTLRLARAADPEGRRELALELCDSFLLDPKRRLSDDFYLFDGTDWRVCANPSEGSDRTELEKAPASGIVDRRGRDSVRSRMRAS